MQLRLLRWMAIGRGYKRSVQASISGMSSLHDGMGINEEFFGVIWVLEKDILFSLSVLNLSRFSQRQISYIRANKVMNSCRRLLLYPLHKFRRILGPSVPPIAFSALQICFVTFH